MRLKSSVSRSQKKMANRVRKPVPKDESKEAKLVRLATNRTKRILRSIEALGNLSRLKPTETQTERVFGAIKKVVESSYGRWKGEQPALPEFDMNAQEPTA